MEEILYSVIVEGKKLAEHMPMKEACLFIEDYMKKHCDKSQLGIEMRRE